MQMKPILITRLYLSLFLRMITVPIFVAGDSPPAYGPAIEDITVKCCYSGKVVNDYDKGFWSGDVNSK